MGIKVSASILKCDFANLGSEILRAQNANADFIHIDVMDGVFVENISFGLPVVKSIRRAIELPLDVHLMITRPERYIKRFAEAGADSVTFHYEATDDPKRCIALCRESGVGAGISIKPDTPAEVVYPFLNSLDRVLVMTVEPGFGGQKLILKTLDKAAMISREIKSRGLSAEVQVDGGINLDTAPEAIRSGACNLVVGSFLFAQQDMKGTVEKLKQLGIEN